MKLPARTANQTLAGYLRSHLRTLQRFADAGVPQAEIRARLERAGFDRISAQTYWKEIWRARAWARRQSALPATRPASDPNAPALTARAPQGAEGNSGLQEVAGRAAPQSGPPSQGTDESIPSGLFTPRARARRKAEVDQFFNEADPALRILQRSRK